MDKRRKILVGIFLAVFLAAFIFPRLIWGSELGFDVMRVIMGLLFPTMAVIAYR
jgi:hypothetical protein